MGFFVLQTHIRYFGIMIQLNKIPVNHIHGWHLTRAVVITKYLEVAAFRNTEKTKIRTYQIITKTCPVLVLREVWESETSKKLPWDFQKLMPGSLGLPTFKDIQSFITKI